MTTTYGVISDLHGIDISVVPPVIQILKNEEIDALVLNGDLMGERSRLPPQEYLATLLEIAGQSGLETYVLRGSHEEVRICEPVIAHFAQKFGNIIDALRHPKVEKKEHHLVFLPGSDWRSGGAVQQGYALDDKNKSGIYQIKEDEISKDRISNSTDDVIDSEISRGQEGYLCIVNMNDLQKLVSDPDRTVVFSHVPRKFNNPETAVDTAEFWETKQPFQLLVEGQVCQVGTIFPGPVGYHLARQGAPIQFKRENRGNEVLKRIYEELGISKNITGHFHESAGRAHDLEGIAVEEGLFVPELFYNASCLDRLMAGVVSVTGPKVAYENVDLRKYFK